MKPLLPRLKQWGKDFIFKRLLKNSSYLVIGNMLSAVVGFLTARFLGVPSYGSLALVMSFVSNINRLLSFRMGDFIVKYMGQHLAHEEKARASAAVKIGLIIESASSLTAFGLCAATAPLAARYFIKDETAVIMVVIFGITILGNFANEVALGILSVTGHFRSQATINFAQSLLTSSLLILVFLLKGDMFGIMLAFMAGKLLVGLAPVFVALKKLPETLGKDWWHTPLKGNLPPRKELLRFIFSTNFSGTINMLARDSEILWVGFFFNDTAAGFYRLAQGIINVYVMPSTPFINTTYPELTRHVALKQWGKLKTLLKRVSLISAAWTLPIALGFALLGKPLLFEPFTILGKTFEIFIDYAPAFPVVLILMVGYGFGNILFWNRSLLLAMGKADTILKISFLTMLLKMTLMVLLVPRLGYWANAALLSLYFVVTISIITVVALHQAARAEREAVN